MTLITLLDTLDLTNLNPDIYGNHINNIRIKVSSGKKIAGVGILPQNTEARVVLPLVLHEDKEYKVNLEMLHSHLYLDLVGNSKGRFHLQGWDYNFLFGATTDNSTPRLRSKTTSWTSFDEVKTDLEDIKSAVRYLSNLSLEVEEEENEEERFVYSISEIAFSLLTLLVGLIEPLRFNSLELYTRKRIALINRENRFYFPLHDNSWVSAVGPKSLIHGWKGTSKVMLSASNNINHYLKKGQPAWINCQGTPIDSLDLVQQELGLIKDKDLEKVKDTNASERGRQLKNKSSLDELELKEWLVFAESFEDSSDSDARRKDLTKFSDNLPHLFKWAESMKDKKDSGSLVAAEKKKRKTPFEKEADKKDMMGTHQRV